MTYTASTSKAQRLRRSAARKARVALVATLVAAAFVVPLLVAGFVAPPAHASTTLMVTNTNDSGAGSLRQAILDANSTTDADVINFNISGTGVQTIKPSTPLPPITHQVTINGYTQPGSSANTKTVGDDASLKVRLDGTNVPTDDGLEISGASGSVIRGLVIVHFGEGIDITGGSIGSRVEGNFIGTNPSGTLAPGNNYDGVYIEPGTSRTMVGGSTPEKRNLISGNGSYGVLVDANAGSSIKGNYVGTDKSGTKALGNAGPGVNISGGATSTTVGGTTAASRNVISANHDAGVEIVNSHGTELLGNLIGTTASGTGSLGNDLAGVQLYADTFDSSSYNSIGDGTAGGSNTIAFNGGDGIEIVGAGAAGNEVSRNSVFSNGGLGIDLLGPGESYDTNVSTPNDAGDDDSGPNNLQNKPVLASAKTVSGTTTIKGTLDTLPLADAAYTVEFYSNPSGNEGRTFVGEKTVKTDGSGHAAFTFTPATAVSVGKTITATATSDVTLDTSEFSAPKTVASS